MAVYGDGYCSDSMYGDCKVQHCGLRTVGIFHGVSAHPHEMKTMTPPKVQLFPPPPPSLMVVCDLSLATSSRVTPLFTPPPVIFRFFVFLRSVGTGRRWSLSYSLVLIRRLWRIGKSHTTTTTTTTTVELFTYQLLYHGTAFF